MKFLGIDTSSKRLVCVAANGGARAAVCLDCELQHSVRLLGEIDGVLSRVGLTLSLCDFLACSVGPGSFTGIRIGISTVKGLCFGAEKNALAVTSLEEIAYADRSPKKISAVDAGHGFWYAEGFGVPLPAGYYAAEKVRSLAEETGAKLLSREPLEGAEEVDPAEGLYAGIVALQTRVTSPSLLRAVYLRKSSAEEGR